MPYSYPRIAGSGQTREPGGQVGVTWGWQDKIAAYGADKGGVNDKSCRIEARLSGRPPIAVHAVATTVAKSVDVAADKLRHAVESIVGRSNQH